MSPRMAASWSVSIWLLTCVVEQLVALVQHKHLQVVHRNNLALSERKNTTGCSYNNVRRVQSLKKLLLVSDWLSAINDFGANIFKELREANDFIFDLVRELPRVAKNDSAGWLRIIIDVLQDSENKDSCLAHAGDSLAEDVGAEHGYWNTPLLNVRGMFETTVYD
jgi:hypothetical protein